MPGRRNSTPRCAYHENGRRCRRNGLGNPPLCHPHRVVLEQAPPAFGGLRDLVDRIRTGQRIPTGTLFDAMADILTGVRMGANEARMASAMAGSRTGPAPGAPPPRHAYPPPPPPPGPPKATDPRWSVLGFQRGDEPLTVRAVEERRRKLARQHHPDRGGKLQTMQRINAAADLLISEIAGS